MEILKQIRAKYLEWKHSAACHDFLTRANQIYQHGTEESRMMSIAMDSLDSIQSYDCETHSAIQKLIKERDEYLKEHYPLVFAYNNIFKDY